MTVTPKEDAPDSIFVEIVSVEDDGPDFGPYRWRKWSVRPFDGSTEYRRVLTMAGFPSTGNEEAEWVKHVTEHDCPYCGGSGHKDDIASPVIPDKPDIAELLIARLRAHTPASLPSYLGQADGGTLLRDCREAADLITSLRQQVEEARAKAIEEAAQWHDAKAAHYVRQIHDAHGKEAFHRDSAASIRSLAGKSEVTP